MRLPVKESEISKGGNRQSACRSVIVIACGSMDSPSQVESIEQPWGYDTVRELANGGTDTVLVRAALSEDGFTRPTSYTLGSNLENATITGTLSFNLIGNAFSNRLIGNSNANTLTGNEGDDTLDGSYGADFLIGGKGNDIYVLNDLNYLDQFFVLKAYDRVTEAASEGIDTILVAATTNSPWIGHRGSYTLGENIENGTITAGLEFDLTGNTLDNTLIGNSGANTLTGGGGNDLLAGGDGFDTLAGGEGDDSYTQYNTNLLFTNFGTTRFWDLIVEDAGGGTDTVYLTNRAGFSSYTIDANVEIARMDPNVVGYDPGKAFTIIGNALNNTIIGWAESDTLSGGLGLDTMIGGSGNDRYALYDTTVVTTNGVTSRVFDTVIETVGGGTDTVYLANGVGISSYTLGENIENAEVDTSTAGYDINAAFTIVSSASDNAIVGQAESDTIRGGGGKDVMNGGEGVDTADYSDKTASVAVTLMNGPAYATAIVGGITEDRIVNFENIIGGSGDDTLVGNAQANVLAGGAGAGLLAGGDGLDTLIGGAGDDRYTQYRTTLSVSRFWDNIVEDAGGGTDTVYLTTGAGLSVYTMDAGIENARMDPNVSNYNANFAFTVNGNELSNTIVGWSEIDTLNGGDGDDALSGGGGADALDGGAGSDTADYSDKTAAVVAFLSGDTNTTVTVGGVIEDTIKNIENLTGGSGADTLIGDRSANILTGAAGDDLLGGGDGLDTLIGGTGSDRYTQYNTTSVTEGGATFLVWDTIREGTGADSGIDTVYLTTGAGLSSYVMDANVEIARMDPNVSNYDASKDFKTIGNDLANTIVGSLEADTLDGGLRADILTGGGGADNFVFSTVLGSATNLDNIDTITDFNVADATIELASSIFSALTKGALSSVDFAMGATASSAAQNLIYNASTGALFYDSDGTGSAAQVQFASIGANRALTASDFQVI